jgi:hypothetical protein
VERKNVTEDTMVKEKYSHVLNTCLSVCNSHTHIHTKIIAYIFIFIILDMEASNDSCIFLSTVKILV